MECVGWYPSVIHSTCLTISGSFSGISQCRRNSITDSMKIPQHQKSLTSNIGCHHKSIQYAIASQWPPYFSLPAQPSLPHTYPIPKWLKHKKSIFGINFNIIIPRSFARQIAVVFQNGNGARHKEPWARFISTVVIKFASLSIRGARVLRLVVAQCECFFLILVQFSNRSTENILS